MYYIYGPAALIFIYVCIYMGRRHQGCLRVRLRPWMFHMLVLTWDAAVLNGSSQMVHFKLLIFFTDLTSRWFHTHTPLRVVHSIFSSSWHVWFGPESRKPVVTWDLVRSVWKGSTLRLPDLIPQGMTNMSVNPLCCLMPRLAYLYIYLFNIEPLSEEPLVRCLFINIFCYLMPRLVYLFIYLFI